MDRNELQVLRQELKDVIVPKCLFKSNSDEVREEIGYDVMRFLTDKDFEFTTINTHTSDELVEQQKIKLQVDDYTLLISATGIMVGDNKFTIDEE